MNNQTKPSQKALHGRGACAVMAFIGLLVVLILPSIVSLLIFDEEFLSSPSLSASLTYEAIAVVCALAWYRLMGERHILKVHQGDISFMLRLGGSILAVSVILALLQATSYVSTGTALAKDWLVSLVQVSIYCLFVGIYEEVMVRGIMLKGLLALLDRSKTGVYISLIISAVFFGSLHIVWPDLNSGDALQVAQAVFKVLQTGLYGFVLAGYVVCRNNLSGPVLFHALDDWLVMVLPYGLFSEEMVTSYVSEGTDGIASLVLYVVISLLYVPAVVKTIKEVNKHLAEDKAQKLEAQKEAVGAQAKAEDKDITTEQ